MKALQSLLKKKHPIGSNRLFAKKERGGGPIIMTVGGTLIALALGVFAIDIPTYFAAQNQLQTAMDAAAIAGAYKLPEGESEAEAAALEVAQLNPVAGTLLDSGDITFSYESGANMTMSVSGEAPVPTIMGKLLCGMSGFGGGGFDSGLEDEVGGEDQGSSSAGPCSAMTVYAHSKAVPAARDTILVIDSSSSMNYGSGSGKPIDNVKTSARYFVATVEDLSNETGSVDRIGVVTFDQQGYKEIGFTLKNKMSNICLWSGGGWNTNYAVGLKKALYELEDNGRKNSKQAIIFLTDGYPNLPAPTDWGYSQGSAYQKCNNIVNYDDEVRDLCYYYKSRGRWYQKCYYMHNDWPNKITDQMVENSGGLACGEEYTEHMNNETMTQLNRAKNMGVTIHTIQMFDPSLTSNSFRNLKALMADEDWDLALLDQFANETDGQQHASATANTSELEAIYETIAEDVKVKLAY